jgi:GWxTD domain-containing protein
MVNSLRPLKYIFVLTILSLLLFFCAAPQRTVSSSDNLYKKNNRELNIKFIAFHINDTITEVFFTIPNEDLIYKRPDTSQWFYAALRIKYSLNANGKLADSGSVVIFDRQGEKVNSKKINNSFKVKARLGILYSANITIFDINKKVRNVKIVEIDKQTVNARQNFLLQSSKGKIIYNYYLHHKDTILIRSLQNIQPVLRIDYFRNEFPLAPPPYSNVERKPFQYQPDSSFILEKKNGMYTVIIPRNGFYHVVTDIEKKEGLTLFSVEPAFPGIQNSAEMIKSTRYIMQKKEFENCLKAPDQKAAVDEFWKDIAGSNERAKELIRRYYGRVQEANALFTSHQPGWQSDRGMIFIIFGAPENMHKYSNGEEWTYGSDAHPTIIRFNFKKMLNPFSDNDYALERNESYKIHWYQAVDHWRQGHIYLDN